MTTDELAARGVRVKAETLAKEIQAIVAADRWKGRALDAEPPEKWHRLRPETQQFWIDEATRILAALEITPDAALIRDAEAAVAMVVEKAARDARDVFSGHKDAKDAIDYMEQLIHAAIAPASGVEALAALRAERDALRAAAEGLIAVLDRNDKKGPIPDVEMMFCWLAAQWVRAAFRKIAPRGGAI